MDRISALMDDELDGRQARLELTRLNRQHELRERWDTFHLIGDALRGERVLSVDFNRHLFERLAQEPTVLAPRRGFARKVTTYAFSAAASAAAIALVAWAALSTNTTPTQPQVASAPVAAVASASTPPAPQLANVPDEGKMSEYLLAHQGFSPSTAIQGVAPYIRSVSASQPARDR